MHMAYNTHYYCRYFLHPLHDASDTSRTLLVAYQTPVDLDGPLHLSIHSAQGPEGARGHPVPIGHSERTPPLHQPLVPPAACASSTRRVSIVTASIDPGEKHMPPRVPTLPAMAWILPGTNLPRFYKSQIGRPAVSASDPLPPFWASGR